MLTNELVNAVEELEEALKLFRYDLDRALEAKSSPYSTPETVANWEKLAVWDFRDVKRQMSKLRRTAE